MEVLRRAANPWGQEVLIGIGWDLMWVAIIAGIVFVVGHLIWLRTLNEDATPGPDAEEVNALPEKITRHGGAARTFHWLMSLSMIVLLITAFFPVVGIQFPWVTIHWAAGVALIVMVAWHIWHSTLRQDFWSMWVGPKEIAELFGQLKLILARSPDSERGGKYPIDHKMYHHGIVLVGFAAIITGILMMVRVDTPFWTRNPYLLGDATWGVVYVVHGLSGVALITMVMAHIYFAIRPEKWWLTRSMIKGWITRTEFVTHFDPDEWKVTDDATEAGAPTGGSGAPASVAPSDHTTT